MGNCATELFEIVEGNQALVDAAARLFADSQGDDGELRVCLVEGIAEGDPARVHARILGQALCCNDDAQLVARALGQGALGIARKQQPARLAGGGPFELA